MTKTKAVTITMIGSAEDRGDVRLADFLEFFWTALRCLRGVDRFVSGKEKLSADYKIVGLRKGSATVQVEPIPYQRAQDYTARIIDTFTDSLDSLTKGKAPPRFDRQLLETFRELAKPLGKRRARAEVKANGKKISITPELEARISQVIGEDILSEGSLGGYLETVNVHGKNEFFIYPTVGGKIECSFPEELLEKVKDGIKRHVNAAGTLRYKKNEVFPYCIDVRSLEIFPPENELPTLESMRGIAPDATGALDSIEFVRRLRGVK